MKPPDSAILEKEAAHKIAILQIFSKSLVLSQGLTP